MDVYLSANEAAAFLGVAKPSLYAYVSRGLVRSQPGANSRARTYNRLDLEQLQARKRIRIRPQAEVAAALHWGAPLLDSSLTLITEGWSLLPGLKCARVGFEPVILGSRALVLERPLGGASSRSRPFPGWASKTQLGSLSPPAKLVN